MAAPASELGWVVYFAPVVRFTPLSPIQKFFGYSIQICQKRYYWVIFRLQAILKLQNVQKFFGYFVV